MTTSPLSTGAIAMLTRISIIVCCWLMLSESLHAEGKEVVLNGQTFTLPEEFEIELAAGPPLVDRPITADFDEQGRMYVTDSSGSNDKVAQQLIDRPHRVVRLEDTDGDGRFDKSVVFADKLMFPEGTLWHAGSLYLATPPSIWKLTDTDGDGVADQREEWFQGKTLTGCANDLHGPYLGPDGWIYWCKGAFAEQTYERPGKQSLVTRASHIFRCRPDAPRDPATGSIATSAIESVMTGGMDNPVDVVFTPEGERIFSTTFFVHPGGGQRDGLIHAIYGGVYGKVHGVLEGHPRTGEVMPVLAHLGAAAPCGLACYESGRFGPEYKTNLFACCFNMHKITRHQLTEQGAGLAATGEDFVTSSNIDFHPTDIQEDADGSLLICDTGGWYKLCCPTSQLWKPDVLGGIYRVRRTGAHAATGECSDPRGQKLAWDKTSAADLTDRLGDERPAVQRRALLELARLGDAAVSHLTDQLTQVEDADHRRNIVWALTRIDSPAARRAVRAALDDSDQSVRRAALHSISLHRDAAASDRLRGMLTADSTESRLAAEGLGRIGDAAAAPYLLAAAVHDSSRAKEHALIYALIEIGDAPALRQGLQHADPRVRRAAVIALDQIDPQALSPAEIAAWLDAPQTELRETAAWIIGRHPEWGGDLAGYMGRRLQAELTADETEALTKQLASFAANPAIQELLATTAADAGAAPTARAAALIAMRRATVKELPAVWAESLRAVLAEGNTELTPLAVAAVRLLPAFKGEAGPLNAALLEIAGQENLSAELRLDALAARAGGPAPLEARLFDFARRHLDPESPVRARAAAVQVLAKAALTAAQLDTLTEAFRVVGPLEATRLLSIFEQSQDDAVGRRLVAALKASPALTSLRPDSVRQVLARYSPEIKEQGEALSAAINLDEGKQKAQLEELVGQVSAGDVRRGLAVFHSTKAACLSCHQLGYLGTNIGPDLSKIGKIRTERDLLEAIVFPSASFVRSYEPVVVSCIDGRIENGILKDDGPGEIVLAKNAIDLLRIRREEIEELQPSHVSIMPAGFGKQLTTQDLADLIAFLKSLQ